MKTIEKYNHIIYILLFGFSFIMMVYENFKALWLWLLIFFLFAFLSVLNDFIINGNLIANVIFNILQYALILLLVFTVPGYGSIPLVFILQIGLFSKYSSRVSALFGTSILATYTFAVYGSPCQSINSIYPLLFLMVAGLVNLVQQLAIKNYRQLRKDNIEQITQLHLNKKQLQDLNRQMKQYSAEMEKMTILRERNRMSKQIHDTIGHVLTAILVQLEAAELLIERNTPEALKKIANAKEQTQVGIRSIKEALSLIDEDYIQFEERIFDIIRNSQRSMNLKILPQLRITGNIPPNTQKLLLSALREGITNGVRHGEATAFVFRLNATGGQILFYLEDNGNGTERISMGYGLTAMEKQTMELGGTLEAYSVKNQGFTLKMTIPYEDENQQNKNQEGVNGKNIAG